MSIFKLPPETIKAIVNEYLLDYSEFPTDVTYIVHRENNPISGVRSLLAFANSCKHFKAIVEPLIFKNFGLYVETTKFFKDTLDKEYTYVENGKRLRSDVSLMQPCKNINFVMNWRSSTFSQSILKYVEHLYLCRVRDARLKINLCPHTSLITPARMPSLRQISFSVKSGCDPNHLGQFQLLSLGMRQYTYRIRCHVWMPLTYWDHDISILPYMNIYDNIESLTIMYTKPEFFNVRLLHLLTHMRYLKNLMIELNLALTDEAEIQLKAFVREAYGDSDSESGSGSDDAQYCSGIMNDFVEDYEPHVDIDPLSELVDTRHVTHYINQYAMQLTHLERVEIFGVKYFDPARPWIIPPSLKYLKLAFIELAANTHSIESTGHSVDHLFLIPSLVSSTEEVNFHNLTSLTIDFSQLDFLEDIADQNPYLTKLTITNINYEKYNEIPDLPEELESLELQLFYTAREDMRGEDGYDVLEYVLKGPNLRSLYFHTAHNSLSLKELEDLVQGPVCPEIQKLCVTVGPPKYVMTAEHMEIDSEPAMRGNPYILHELYRMFQEEPEELAEMLPENVSIVDFCYLVEVYPPRYRKDDYVHTCAVPYLGPDFMSKTFIINIDDFRQCMGTMSP